MNWVGAYGQNKAFLHLKLLVFHLEEFTKAQGLSLNSVT